MGFSESINGFFGLCGFGECPYRITILGSNGVYVEGVERVCDLKTNQIVISLKGARLIIHGKSLVISSYVQKDLTVKGKVEKLEWN